MKKRTMRGLLLLLCTIAALRAGPRDELSTTLNIHDDNNDTTLPKSYRSWYYEEFRGLDTSVATKIHVRGDGWQGGTYVIPVYSYYGTKWYRFERDEIFEPVNVQKDLHDYTIYKKFDRTNVFIARYYPYEPERLEKLEKRLSFKSFFRSTIIGQTGSGRMLKMFTLTDFSVPNNLKKAIWIHARTHPSETGSSFVAEGLMEYILKEKSFEEMKISLRDLVFYIVPMVNLDGVVEGNARVTPVTSIDLEREWLFDVENSRTLLPRAAPEARALNNTINRLTEEGNRFILSLNLHSTNSTAGTYPFIFTNFSRPLPEHGAAGDSMFAYHLRYAALINDYLCGGKLNVVTSYSPTKPMHLKTYPESWWWTNYRERVVAFTLETAYMHPGCYGQRVSYRDNLQLGEALAKAIQKYHELYHQGKAANEPDAYNRVRHLEYFIGPN